MKTVDIAKAERYIVEKMNRYYLMVEHQLWNPTDKWVRNNHLPVPKEKLIELFQAIAEEAGLKITIKEKKKK
jgi:hypothetical protein